MPTASSIWIVDDDASVRRGMRRLVLALACDAEVCVSGDELLARLAVARPTFMLLDIQMPDLSGIETLREMRARGITVPTVMMTGVERDGVREACLAAGALDVLAKPVSAQAITDMLSRIESGRAAV